MAHRQPPPPSALLADDSGHQRSKLANMTAALANGSRPACLRISKFIDKPLISSQLLHRIAARWTFSTSFVSSGDIIDRPPALDAVAAALPANVFTGNGLVTVTPPPQQGLQHARFPMRRERVPLSVAR